MTTKECIKFEYIDPKELIPYANNARIHPENQIRRLMGSLREYGVVIPILIGDDNVIIAGHGVTEAALRIGIEEVPCVRASHLTEAQRRAFILAANRLAEDSSWDTEILKLEMLRLREDYGVDLELTGFTPREIVRLRLDMQTGNADEDTVPDVKGPPVSRLGDVWELGEHRIICGDSSDARVAERLLSGARPHLMVTDPPYGVNYGPAWRKKVGKSHGKRDGKVLNDDTADWREVWALFPGDVAYVWHAGLYGETVARSIRANGFAIRSQIIWAKPHFALARGDYHWQHECCLYALKKDGAECPDNLPGYCDGYESCWYAVREGNKSHWQGDRKSSTLWDIDFSGQDTATTYGTQKPVECMRRPILNNSEPGDLVYEPFSGSGTTIIAAHSIKRACYAVELDPAYVDMAVRRWQDYASRSAILSGTKQSFDAVSKKRVGKHDEQ